MPTYDFRCKACENKFTVRISISERQGVKCPNCNSSAVQQIFTTFAVAVKSGEPQACDLSCGAKTKFG